MKTTKQSAGGHHLILGQVVDFVTGDILDDTHDERYRQNLARLLVYDKGYSKKDIEPRYDLAVQATHRRAIVKVDFLIHLSEKVWMIIKYGPGSIVTRQRPALAASRLVRPYQVPVVVVTNGENADVLDGSSGKLIGSGLSAIPSKSELIKKYSAFLFNDIPDWRAELESRIIYAYEVDGSCQCDDTICRL